MLSQTALQTAFNRTFTESGDNWKASCPFHKESTPSFYVHKYDYIAHCFGCGVAGPVDKLLVRFCGTTEQEARRLLGVSVESKLLSKRSTDKRETQIYPESWLSPYKKEVHKYVLSRGFRLNTLAEAESKYDPVSKRQLFPHRNREGRLLGAIGRACEGQEPKWYFYWGYDKGQALYQDHRASNTKRLLVVEGVFDALWLRQHGYTAAALLGSKATHSQIRELTSQYNDVVLGLDNDEAGYQGTEQIRMHARKMGTRLRFLQWPQEANDWCDLSKDQIEEVLANPLSYVSWKALRASDTSS